MKLESTDDLNLILTSNDTLSMSLSPQNRNNMNLVLGVPKVISGVYDYERLNNKPQIENVELTGNKTFSDLGLNPIDANDLLEILN